MIIGDEVVVAGGMGPCPGGLIFRFVRFVMLLSLRGGLVVR